MDLWPDGRPHTRTVHVLVLTAFVGPVPAGMEGCHIDGNRANNRRDNLKWGTHRENVADQIRHGTLASGSRHWNAKMDEAAVRDLRTDYATGRIGYRRLAKKYDITMGAVRSIVLRESWKHVV